MTAKQFLEALSYINDEYIIKYAEIKPVVFSKKFLFRRISVIAACLIIIFFSTLFLDNFFSDSDEKIEPDDSVNFTEFTESIQYIKFNGNKYRVVLNDNSLSIYNLPTLTDEFVGEELGNGAIESNGKTIPVYDYLGYNGRSVLIAKINSQYYYLVFWSPADINKPLTVLELFELYGINDSEAEITYQDQNFDIALISELKKSTVLSQELFDKKIENSDAKECFEIIVTSPHSEKLILNYYPNVGVAYCGFMYFEFTPDALRILNN
ncbi:hypothetical protein [Anaerofustis sp.]|uniref:hypothetical protein n=1 Tax=Anaerofustis sp. TaxID=1872517 RepID=UPI0025C25A13|nr:hypothetical protein [Anaerofustis sp.]